MTGRWANTRMGTSSRRIQAAMPNRQRVGVTQGWNIRGVVINSYYYDDQRAIGTRRDVSPNALYVDVMGYGRYSGLIRGVLWTADRTGLQEGDISLPRPTTTDITGTLNINHSSNPASWDGDHVVVSFLEDDPGLPFVVRSIHHPSSDIGNAALQPGHRMRILKADGQPRFWKHKGVYFGVDNTGNYILDTTRGHTGGYAVDGSELPNDGPTSGGVTVNIPNGAEFKITAKDANHPATSVHSDAHVCRVENLEAMYDDLKDNVDEIKTKLHTHYHDVVGVTAGAATVTGTASTGAIPITDVAVKVNTSAPAWDPDINSTKVTIPDA